MLEALLKKLFIKLEQEPTNDKKSKNGCAVYFIEQILEKRFEKFNLISTRGLKDYYDKHVLGKENSSGEPNTELKNLISIYLGFDDYLDFENKSTHTTNTPTNRTTTLTNLKSKIRVDSIKKLSAPVIVAFLLYGTYLIGRIPHKDCIVWRTDHYEKIDCNNKTENISINTVDTEHFKKIEVDSTTLFFIKNKAVVWYGKSASGEMDYFNSKGEHPITGKNLKPITKYIIHKYIETSKK